MAKKGVIVLLAVLFACVVCASCCAMAYNQGAFAETSPAPSPSSTPQASTGGGSSTSTGSAPSPSAGGGSAPSAGGGSAPSTVTGAAVNWVTKSRVAHYLGDSQLAAKTISTQMDTIDGCKTRCNANPSCTHFNYIADDGSCTLFSGAEWVGEQYNSTSYCKSQCQS